MSKIICPHCKQETECVGGKRIYPHRRDLFHKWFYLCERCGAYCGCHPGSKRPLGSPADHQTRKARKAAHAAFDPLWRKGPQKEFDRTDAYAWLSKKTGIPEEQCHIGMMTSKQCRLVVEVIRQFKDRNAIT